MASELVRWLCERNRRRDAVREMTNTRHVRNL